MPMPLFASLTFAWTPWSLAAGVALVVAAAILCAAAWRRKGGSRRAAALESLRLLIVVLVAVTLNQPEWLATYRPDERPRLLVVVDDSPSMATRDVVGPSGGPRGARTRREAVAPLLDPKRWKRLADRFDVVIEPFSSNQAGSRQGTDLHAALAGAVKHHTTLRAVVLASDGDWNRGEPPLLAAGALRARQVPVFTLPVGSPSRLPDVALTRVDLPAFAVLGKPLRIPVGAASSLPRDYKATLALRVEPRGAAPAKSGKAAGGGKPGGEGGDEVEPRAVTPSDPAATLDVTLPAMGRIDKVLRWTPREEGDFQLTIELPAHEAEIDRENNRRVLPIQVRREAIRVLLIESVPRWEYRYLRNALWRDPGVEVTSLLFQPGLSKVGGGHGYIDAFPETDQDLARFDVVLLGDVGIEDGELTVQQCRRIKDLIQSQASGLILMPGAAGRQLSLVDTPLGELFPVVFDAGQPGGWGTREPAQFELTLAGRRSLLTKLEEPEEANARLWETLPGFHWYAPILRAKAGSEVLAIHRDESNRFGPIPLLVAKTYGTGKVLLMGTDGAWRWRRGVEDKYHYRFWGQVARWMAYQRTMAHDRHMRLFYSPDRPHEGDSITLNANIMTPTGEPLETGQVMVVAVAPSGETEQIRLEPVPDSWGLFSGVFAPTEAGRYQLKLLSPETDASLATWLDVAGAPPERIGQPARPEVLDEIARATGGSTIDPRQIGQLIQRIAELPEPPPQIRRLRLWCHPAWVGAIVVLLGIFWIGRKLAGLV